jgi:hypothetical protein
MKRFILRILGWYCFVYDRVCIYQKGCLVDQTLITDALDVTKPKRSWCDDRSLSIFVEPVPFRGVYGVKQTAEVARFDGWLFRRKSANIRIAAESLSSRRLVRLLTELNRVSPK